MHRPREIDRERDEHLNNIISIITNHDRRTVLYSVQNYIVYRGILRK